MNPPRVRSFTVDPVALVIDPVTPAESPYVYAFLAAPPWMFSVSVKETAAVPNASLPAFTPVSDQLLSASGPLMVSFPPAPAKVTGNARLLAEASTENMSSPSPPFTVRLEMVAAGRVLGAPPSTVMLTSDPDADSETVWPAPLASATVQSCWKVTDTVLLSESTLAVAFTTSKAVSLRWTEQCPPASVVQFARSSVLLPSLVNVTGASSTALLDPSVTVAVKVTLVPVATGVDGFATRSIAAGSPAT